MISDGTKNHYARSLEKTNRVCLDAVRKTWMKL